MDYLWVDERQPLKTLEVRWSLPDGRPVDLPHLRFVCREFVPKSEDTHFISWQVHGKVMTVQLPPFAVCDPPDLKARVSEFLDAACPSVLDYILEGLEDERSILTMKEAMRYTAKNQSKVINLALKIRCASFCSQGWGSITGTETLGIERHDFNEFGKCGYAAYDRGVDRPLPLSIDHQIDVALLLTIKEYQKTLLKELQRKIFQKGEKPWYEIYLTTYILLSNLEYVHGGSYSFMQALVKTVRNPISAQKTQSSHIFNHYRSQKG